MGNQGHAQITLGTRDMERKREHSKAMLSKRALLGAKLVLGVADLKEDIGKQLCDRKILDQSIVPPNYW